MERSNGAHVRTASEWVDHSVLIVGVGAAGITVAAELKRFDPDLDVAIVEPPERDCYQPGWTLVGAGALSRKQTERREANLSPKGVSWIRASVTGFDPDQGAVRRENGRRLRYAMLVACPGLKLDREKIEGLTDTLGKNGVCSNYRPDLAKYTWRLSQDFRDGTTLFRQPLMPIKRAGARRKIMYLMADHLRRRRRISASALKFCLAGDALNRHNQASRSSAARSDRPGFPKIPSLRLPPCSV